MLSSSWSVRWVVMQGCGGFVGVQLLVLLVVVVLLVLVLVGVRHLGDVPARSDTYAAKQAGTDRRHLAAPGFRQEPPALEAPADTVGGMSDDSPVRRCQWCGGNFLLGSVGRRAVYCRPSCRQRAYEARREARRIAAAVAAAAVSSRDSRTAPNSPRDETEFGQVPPPALPDPGDGWVRSAAEVDAQLRELEARRAAVPPAPVRQKRRRLAPPPAAAAPTLFEPERGGASGTANDTLPGPGETGTDTE